MTKKWQEGISEREAELKQRLRQDEMKMMREEYAGKEEGNGENLCFLAPF